MTHGFYIVMGGFHLFEHRPMKTSNNDEFKLHDNDIPLRPLAARDLYGDITNRSIKADIDFTSFTVPTEEEIKDKGKSDWLAKSLVLLQTSWFVMQCIARGIKHLPVTHLEIVTLAYAAMNFVIYIFWWNKPLNVNRPVRVFRKSNLGAESGLRETQPDVTEPIPEARGLTWEAIGNDFKRIHRFIAGSRDDHVDLSGEDRVPMFWANGSGGDAVRANLMVLLVGVYFGAIHCIAWDFSFPTCTELIMWRVLCVAITAVPIYTTLGFYLATRLGKMGLKKFRISVLFFCTISGVMVYIIARAFTLALAFTSLRDLPPRAYETVHWTIFIPHI